MTKIDIISGFLGAGKTTFIKYLLKEAVAGERVVLIENEFGEIGIDGGFLKDSGIEIREMNSGCICCSLVGDFSRSLTEVLTKYTPDRVIIEPSGVGKLSDVMKAVKDAASEIEVVLNSAVTVVDAAKCRLYMKNFGEFFNNQIENAGIIVLSRTDITEAKKVQAAVDMIREHNKDAVIITTPCSELSGLQLLEIIEKKDDMAEELMEEARAHMHEHHHGKGCGCKGHDHDDDGHCGCGGHGHDENDECACEGHGHEDGHAHGDTHGHDENDGCCCKGHAHEKHPHEEHPHEHIHDHNDGCTCGGHEHDHAHDHDHNHEHAHDHNHAHAHDHHHADEVFTSWGRENVTGITREKLEKLLDDLAYGTKYGEVLRAKGMLPGGVDGAWLHFDLVPEQVEIREGSPDYTGKVCVIGSRLNEEALKAAFAGE